MLTFISLPFERSLKVVKELIILVGQSSSTEIKIHLLISSWIKSEVVIDFLIKVLTIWSVKGWDLLWNFRSSSPKQINAILLTPDLILFKHWSSYVIIMLKYSSDISYLWFSMIDRRQFIDSNWVFQLLSFIIINAFSSYDFGYGIYGRFSLSTYIMLLSPIDFFTGD